MNNKILKSLLGATSLSLAIIGSANAGGFSRGSADTDILYEPGNFNMRSSMTIVSPTRKFDSNPGNPKLNGEDFAETYVVPSAAMKMNLTDSFRCATTFVQAYGGHARYEGGKDIAQSSPTGTPSVRNGGKTNEEFTIYESALTCAVKFDVGKGSLYVLGGGFQEKFDYSRQNVLGVAPGGNFVPIGGTSLELEGESYGFRVGTAYEIPEIAFRTELMYRSGTSYGADGSFRLTVPGRNILVPAIGTGELPQSVELSLQSGIAPGWLGFASVKWMDWSVTKQLISEAPALGLVDANEYHYRDGWTVTGGVGHAFSDTVSGLVALTWDRGVGTGWDHASDTYTLSLGGSFKDKWGGELRAGVGLSYLTSAEETQYSRTVAPTDPRFGSNTSVDAGYAAAFNIGYAIKW